jgi:hypothetical protein
MFFVFRIEISKHQTSLSCASSSSVNLILPFGTCLRAVLAALLRPAFACAKSEKWRLANTGVVGWASTATAASIAKRRFKFDLIAGLPGRFIACADYSKKRLLKHNTVAGSESRSRCVPGSLRPDGSRPSAELSTVNASDFRERRRIRSAPAPLSSSLWSSAAAPKETKPRLRSRRGIANNSQYL